MNNKVNIGNVQVDNLTKDEVLKVIEHLVQRNEPCYINPVNVDAVFRYNRDTEYARFFDDGMLCITDGTPIIWASRYLRTPLKEKVSGSDVVLGVCALAHKVQFKIFFLGGRPGAAYAAKYKIQEALQTTGIIDTYCPPYDFEKYEHELNKIVGIIKSSKPHVLFVGLGSPKREKWIGEYYRQLGVPVSMGVGAAFEWISGTLMRAPKWMQSMGLEWLWRLILEPKRLWRRYLIDDMQFFPLIVKQKITKGQRKLQGLPIKKIA